MDDSDEKVVYQCISASQPLGLREDIVLVRGFLRFFAGLQRSQY